MPLLMSNKRTVMGFIFSRPESFEPSMAIENGEDFIALTSLALK